MSDTTNAGSANELPEPAASGLENPDRPGRPLSTSLNTYNGWTPLFTVDQMRAYRAEAEWKRLDAENAELRSEVARLQADAMRLRKKAKAQRAELRRLNKYLGPYWAGYRRGIDLRLFEEFGQQPAVFAAEQNP